MKSLEFDLVEFGLKMQQWHAGQGDPIYAVGSCCFASHEENLDAEDIERAQSRLERISRECRGLAESDADECAELARQCGELLEALYPVTYGSGMPGCLYDNGPNRASSVEEAISSLVETFSDALEPGEEARMRNALSRGSGACHVFENQEAAGAHYCEISF